MTPILQRNLAAAPELAERIARAPAAESLLFLTAPGGLVIPARLRDGRPRPYHSTVDPMREAARLAAASPAADYTVVLGLGGGYHLGALLTGPSLGRLLVVERDAALARAVLERIDLQAVLADPRTRLLAGLEPREVQQAVLDEYLPVLHGGLRTRPLRAAVEEDPAYYGRVTRCLEEAAAAAADDYAVQARLGRRWFVNTVANLEAAAHATVRLPAVQRAAVTGAGPSLEAQAPRLAAMRGELYLIASDASLPALAGFGLTPDLVVSIDCQQASYLHFLPGLPERVPLALDLASPPVLGRRTRPTLYFAGGHPLSRYLASQWLPMPAMDTSGGNVAQAAVSLAVGLGAREVLLAGMDFACPQGKPYSRGTFLYAHTASRETRLATAESWFLAFQAEGRNASQPRYTSRPLDLYRRRLEAYARTVPARLALVPGATLPLDLPERPLAPGRAVSLPPVGHPARPWRAFLEDYAAGLRDLPEPSEPAHSYLGGLDAGRRALWATLLPAAASLRARLPQLGAAELLARTREWSFERVRRRLDS